MRTSINTCIRFQSLNVLRNPPKENYNFINTRIYQLANASLTETIFKLKPLQICGTQLFTGCNTSKLIPEKEKCKIKEAKFD